MKSKIKLTKDIIAITLKIDDNYPELSKFLDEMPEETKFSVENVTARNLFGYYDSLDTLFEDYSKSHVSMKPEPYLDYFIT